MKALLIDGETIVQEIDIPDTSALEDHINVSKMDYEEAHAQVWGGKEKGAKGVRITYCLGELPPATLIKACIDDSVWINFHLTDAIDSVIREYQEDMGAWTDNTMQSLASQFDEFAARLRKAVN